MTVPTQRYFIKFDSMPMRLDEVSQDPLVEGERCVDIGRRSYHVEPFKTWCNALNKYPFYSTTDKPGFLLSKKDSGARYTYTKKSNPSPTIVIIDSQDAWHREYDIRFRLKPTDEELVKLFQELQQTDNLHSNVSAQRLAGSGYDLPFVINRDGVPMFCTIDDMRAAWARTLKKQITGKRSSVIVQIDDGSADDI